MDEVLYAIDDGVAVIQLNRPDRGNTWTHDLDDKLAAAFDEANSSSSVTAIIVSGTGDKFCLGMDLDILDGLSADGNLSEALGDRLRIKCDPSRSPKPVIAALNGSAAGVGLALALMCDIRIAASNAKFSFSYVRRGLVAEQAESWWLPRIVGLGHATDLLLTGRMFTALEAERIGLVSKAVNAEVVLKEAVSIARQISTSNSPWAMGNVKRQLQADSFDTLAGARARAEDLVRQSLERDDVREGVRSFLDKRNPRFVRLRQGAVE